MKTNRIKQILPFFLIFCSFGAMAQKSELAKGLESFNTFMFQVDRFYVDSVDGSELIANGMRSILEDLDPHSVFIPKDELARMNEPLQGKFEGIGVQFNILRDTILVVATIAGGPSEKLGIQAGDRIVTIDGEVVAGVGIQNSGVMERLRGDKGTVVNVEINRKGNKHLLPFKIVRDKIPIFSVDAGYMLTKTTGYIKVNRFGATTHQEYLEQFNELKEAGMKNLILDLQGNGGGYLNTAFQLADEFLSGEKLVVYTEGKAFPREDLITKTKGGFEQGRLAVLIDESSASASEIVAGAIQDWDRGLIVGRRSFGKGLVQRQFNLPDQSAMRLTVSRYYTPSGRSIQKPYEQGFDKYISEKYERYNSGELFSADSIDFPDSLKYETDNKRIVYGGGGIMPDYFVPLDTSQTSDFFSLIVRKGILNQFTLDYANENRESILKKYTTASQFAAKFNADDLKADIQNYVDNEGVKWNEEQFQISKDWILVRAKALIARSVWDTEAYYVVINELNNSLQEALKLIEGKGYRNYKLASKI